jgi:hypothetical protein
MNSKQTFINFLFFIFGLLAMAIYLKGVGYFYFQYYEQYFDKSFMDCGQAIAAEANLINKNTDVDLSAVNSSLEFMRVSCSDLKNLTSHLLKNGVSESQIKSRITELVESPEMHYIKKYKPIIFNE